MTQADVQAAGGPSTATLRLIEGGKHTDFRPATRQPLKAFLQWMPGSVSSVLDGGEPTPMMERSPEYRHLLASDVDRLRRAIDAAIASGDRDAQLRAHHNLAVIQAKPEPRTNDSARRVTEADDTDQLDAMVALSFFADELDAVSSIMTTEPDDDPGDIETFVYEVESLVSAADELTDAVHKTVLEAFGGDVAKLRQMKREVRRVNQARSGLRQETIFESMSLAQNLTLNEDEDPFPELAAARAGPPGYTPGRSEHGDAGSEESQIDPGEEEP